MEEQRFAPSAGIEASPTGIDAAFGGRLYCDLVFADVPVPGPGQVYSEMTQDPVARARLKPFEASPTSQLNFGNLLTVPLDGSFLYVEPVYAVRGGTSSFRILQFVIISYNSKIGVGNDLAQALSNALGVAPPSGGDDNGTAAA